MSWRRDGCERLICKENDGRYKGHLRTGSMIQVEGRVSICRRYTLSHPDFRVLTQGIDIGALAWAAGETSGKEYVSLSLAPSPTSLNNLYANLGHAAVSNDKYFTSLSVI